MTLRLSSLPDHWLLNKMISGVRFAWYAVSDPMKLRWFRSRETIQYLAGVQDLPLVSVIIPTHNRADLLTQVCLPSVLRQTHKNLEIIVVAHGCEDTTMWELRYGAIQIGDDRIKPTYLRRHVHYPDTPENRWFAGPVDPINEGLKHVTGKWIARIDDDDEWTPDHIEVLLAEALSGNYEFVSSGHVTHKGPVEPYTYRADHIDKANLVLPHTRIGGTQTWLFRSYLRFFKWNPDCWRKRWNRVNDTDIQDRMYKAGVRMGYTSKITAKVLPRPGETEVGLKAYQMKG